MWFIWNIVPIVQCQRSKWTTRVTVAVKEPPCRPPPDIVPRPVCYFRHLRVPQSSIPTSISEILILSSQIRNIETICSSLISKQGLEPKIRQRNTCNGLRTKTSLFQVLQLPQNWTVRTIRESRDVSNLRRQNRNRLSKKLKPTIRNSTLAFEWDSLNWLNYFFHIMPMQLWWSCTQEFFFRNITTTH